MRVGQHQHFHRRRGDERGSRMVRGDEHFDLHPKLFGQLFGEFIRAFGSPGVDHMTMTNLQFQGIHIVFSDHVDVGWHSLGNTYPVSGPTIARISVGVNPKTKPKSMTWCCRHCWNVNPTARPRLTRSAKYSSVEAKSSRLRSW